MRRWKLLSRRWAFIGLVLVGGVTAGAVALAARGGGSQFSGRTVIVSNRVLTAPNTGPNEDGNSGELLLRLRGFGDFTITRCIFHNDVSSASVSFRNTARIPVEVIGISAFNREPTFAPGESAVVEFFNGQPSRPSQLLLAGGTNDERRVASVQFTSLFETTSNQCSFDIQATAQSAHPPGKG